VQGGITYARGVGAAPGAVGYNPRTFGPDPEAELDSTGSRSTQQRHILTGRLAATVKPLKWLSLTAGVSGLTSEVRSSSKAYGVDDTGRGTNVAADLTLGLGPVTVFGEYQKQVGPAVRDADYAWVGARYGYKGLQVRMSASYVRYKLDPVVEEYMLLPGTAYTIGGLTAIVEYDEWRRRDPRRSSEWEKYDRSMNFVLAYSY